MTKLTLLLYLLNGITQFKRPFGIAGRGWDSQVSRADSIFVFCSSRPSSFSALLNVLWCASVPLTGLSCVLLIWRENLAAGAGEFCCASESLLAAVPSPALESVLPRLAARSTSACTSDSRRSTTTTRARLLGDSFTCGRREAGKHRMSDSRVFRTVFSDL